MKIVDWYYGSEEDRAVVRMWCALRLPVEHSRTGRPETWYPLDYIQHDGLTTYLKKTQHESGYECFYDHIQFRLKPNEDR